VDAAEDEDGFQDGDGCPDPDDDGDGIADAVDRCRREAETRDGVTDADGCPEGTPKRGAGMTAAGGADRAPADRDGDGLPDGKDRCPDVAETENGYEDEDGCPDTTPPVLVGISGVVDEIQFDLASARFRRGAIPILERVAGALAGNEALELVIAGHTDNQGNRDWNVDLSQLRADAVRHWLVHRGIDAGRIQSVGYGPDRPAASNDTPKGQAKNRRVELSYRERTDAGSGSRDGGQP